MIIKCPHCNEEYSVDYESLSRSAGNDNKGYGWNFKCHKCSKQWWLSSLDVTGNIEKCLRKNGDNVSATKKAENLSKLSRVKRQIVDERSSKQRRRLLDLAFFVAIVCGFAFWAYCSRDSMTSFIANKKKTYASKFNDLLVVYDVFFDISDYDESTKLINVCGTILNKYNNAVDIMCLEIVVKDNGEVVQEWSYVPDYGIIASGNVFNFDTQHKIAISSEDGVSVEVNVIHNHIHSRKNG